ncbi:MAG: diaminopimelate epimerase, partial [Lachnospiraceae bacterium]|nr:diaminopimelate epimerase [Lachnospiraceae bacterium]
MKFTKMHGCGNDYIYIYTGEESVADEDKTELSIKLSDRHKGIGSDGIIFINPTDKADFEMEMYNADGSRGKMCGNGIRCVGKYVYDHGLT